MRLLEDAVVPGTGKTAAESRGTGIGAMLEALRHAGMSPPQFDDKIGVFRVTFPRHSLLDADTLEWLSALGARDLTDSQRVALVLMRAGESLTNARYRQVSGKDSRVVTSELRDLVGRGLAEMRSAGRWTHYGLGPVAAGVSAAPAATAMGAPGRLAAGLPVEESVRKARRRADRRPDILRVLTASEPLSRAEIEERLNLKGGSVPKWLKRLLIDGEIEATRASTRDPNTKYRLPHR